MSSSAADLRLLQITLVVRDLAAAEAAFRERLGLEVAFRDPGVAQWGLENVVLPMGTTFFEILSPTRDDTPGARHLARQGGDGGYMVILKTRAIDHWRARTDALGIRRVFEADTHDAEHGLRWTGIHLHPRDTGGLMISFDRPDPFDSWVGAGSDWRDFVRQDVVDSLEGITLRSPAPERLAARWADLFERPAEPYAGGHRIALDHGWIDFVAGGADEPEGLASVTLRASGPERRGERFTLCGVGIELI